VPRTGFEPAHLSALPPEGSASTNFATWAGGFFFIYPVRLPPEASGSPPGQVDSFLFTHCVYLPKLRDRHLGKGSKYRENSEKLKLDYLLFSAINRRL
jgi:hypothetical protein